MEKNSGRHRSEKHDREILDLAVNCRFISREQEKKILSELKRSSAGKKVAGSMASRFLYTKKILPKEQVELLLSIQNHLATLMEDKRFGKIGVANDFVSPKSVKKALDLQVAIFRKNKKSVKIGDILVSSNAMRIEDQTAILLTQDRVRDDLLAHALNTMAKTEIERLDINKRFGAIAVKKNLINTEQLNQALNVQKKENKTKKEGRYLGEILKEMFGISDEDVLGVLRIQKKFEVQRLSLEKKLMEFNTAKESDQTLDQLFEYQVSSDRLTAVVNCKTSELPNISSRAFLEWLSASGIVFGICAEDDIISFLTDRSSSDSFEVARGTAPVPHGKAKTQILFDVRQGKNSSQTVKQGDCLATFTSAEPGREGKDVFGRPIPVKGDVQEPFVAGDGVIFEAGRYLAAVDGTPLLFNNRTLFVTPDKPDKEEIEIIEIQSDITKDMDESGHILKVEGNISSGASIKCHKLNINGDVLGNVTASGDVDVHGSIGQAATGDDTAATVRVETSGKIYTTKNIANAELYAGSGLQAPRSDLVCSNVTAFGDVVLKNILSDEGHPTRVSIGRQEILAKKKAEQGMAKIQSEIDDMEQKNEMAALTQEMMVQVQTQNAYLEKQNVIIFLGRVLNDPDLETTADIEDSIAAFKRKVNEREDENDILIPEKTKAHQFMDRLVKKIKPLGKKDQQQYVDELGGQIAGMYKAAVRMTERAASQHDARTRAIQETVKKRAPEIEKKKEQMERFKAEYDKAKEACHGQAKAVPPVIKVKNKVSRFTVIEGEAAELVMDQDVHGVSFREEPSGDEKDAAIQIEGYFE